MKPEHAGKLYRQRAAAYRKRTWPYYKYVVQSGLPIVLGFGGVIFLAFYTNLLQNDPFDFPLTEVAVILLTMTLAISPIRTYSQQADSLFLMPATSVMHGYFRKALNSAFVWQIAPLLVVWLFVWPLYRLRERLEGTPLIEGWFWLGTAFLLIVKLLSLYGKWREDQLREHRQRRLLAVWRWAVIGGSLTGLFLWQLSVAAAIAVFGFCLHLILTSRATSFQVHWEQLNRNEQAARRRTHTFLRAFVDIPADQARVSRRRLLTLWTKRIRIHPSETYRYLYWLQLLRTERLSMLVRMTVLAIVVMVIVNNVSIMLFVYALGLVATSLQLSGFWRETEPVAWVHLYPLRVAQRAESFSRIARTLHAVLVPILAMPLFFHHELPLYGSLLAVIAGWLWSWRTGRYILKLERKREQA